MTRDVVTAMPSESLLEAVKRMRQWGVSGLPVVDPNEGVVGVLSEKDLCRVVSESTGSSEPGSLLTLAIELGEGNGYSLLLATRSLLEQMHVAQAMTSPPETVTPTTTIGEAAQVLKKKRINRLPVVEDGRIVGIITRYDLVVRG